MTKGLKVTTSLESSAGTLTAVFIKTKAMTAIGGNKHHTEFLTFESEAAFDAGDPPVTVFLNKTQEFPRVVDALEADGVTELAETYVYSLLKTELEDATKQWGGLAVTTVVAA